jgi:4-amino-4-deoxy-L-arabinose transferase-like glycosyltransferase
MATALSGLSTSSLHPHFFAYGQFPLYLGYLILKLLGQDNSFTNSVIILRFLSAIFSSLSVYIFYLISKRFTIRPFIPTLFFIFTPGLIQLSHFGTTESLLILVFLSNIYLAFKLSLSSHPGRLYLLAAIISGIGIATKISALFFILPIIIVSLRRPVHLIIFILLSLSFSFLLSPYNLLAKSEFISSMRYETQVATGKMDVFYTTQFKDTIPYLFQFTHIFPYVVGLPMFVLFFLGLIHKSYVISHKLTVLFVPVLLYVLYFGQLYTKWTRFMSPVFFIFPLVAGILIAKVGSRLLRFILVVMCVVPGFYFMNLYFLADTRIASDQWLRQNVSSSQTIMSESGNVVNLPSADYYHDFYSHDQDKLSNNLSAAEYIVVPSRRVFKNGIMPTYYEKLFSGELGFTLVKEFRPNTDFLLDPELAEETWSVFDRPTVRIYKRYEEAIK